MVDTRCADPDLQLDVDVMILDYTLFQAIEAQFQSLLSFPQDQDSANGALRAVAIFDSFVKVFNAHHPNYEQAPELNFEIDILEFLVLLSGLSSIPPSHITHEMLEKLKQRTHSDLEARRSWLAARERHFRRLEKRPATSLSAEVARDVELQIYKAWESRLAPASSSDLHTATVLLLFSLPPRFMVISAKFLDVIDQSPNETWMEAACELMFRASLESLRLQTQNRRADTLPTLEDCFAWGYVDPPDPPGIGAAAMYDEEIVDLVNKLFRSPPDDSGSTAEIENPDWTKLRLDTLHEFSIAPNASISSQSCRLERLADKYPLEAFQRKLVRVIQSIWTISCQDEIVRKPVLVEIEEGHLKSLGIEGLEFEDFTKKVGYIRALEELKGYIVRKDPDTVIGLVGEQSLNERYEHELECRKRADGMINGNKTVIKLEG